MRILFISSSNIIAGDLARRMKEEGNAVKLFIDDPSRKENFTNIVDKTEDWRKELTWVGKDGLIVFDDIGYGKVQDQLRADGYSVCGGCELSDKLESDRQFAQEIFAAHGIKTVPIKNFKNIDECIEFIKQNKGAWVIKQNGHASKSLNYVGQFDDSRDVLDLLKNYSKNVNYQMRTITLQQRIKGVEIGVARYFNGIDWVGPIEMNIEHKKFFPSDLGPPTSEMGTLAWYDDNDTSNKLFQETLAKLKPYLQKINFKGDIDINCIVNETGAYPLEATPRFGSPVVYLQTEIQKTPWSEFLKAVADGKPCRVKYQRGYGIVVLLTVPPFPYTKKLKEMSPRGLKIYFSQTLKDKDFKHIHFEGVATERVDGKDQYYISDDQGYVMYVTALGRTVKAAQKKAYGIAKNIFIPKMFYRNDIGHRFLDESYDKLRWWGYL